MILFLIQCIYFSQAFNHKNISYDLDVDILTKDNIVNVFDQTNYSFKYSDFKYAAFDDFEIHEKIIKTKLNHYKVFRVTKNNTNKYFVFDYKILLGSGMSGTSYQGYDIMTGKNIVMKELYGSMNTNEISCLKKVSLHIAHTWNTILMERAQGITYLDIIMNKSICDERKIELHNKIIIALNNLHETHNIQHNDLQPRHIFIDVNDTITFIDFSLSFYTSEHLNLINIFLNLINGHFSIESDLTYLCRFVKYYQVYSGIAFNQYIDSMYYSSMTVYNFILQCISIFVAIFWIFWIFVCN